MEDKTAKKSTPPANIYPALTLDHITNPNRFYAFFVLGFVIKCIILIPQAIEMLFLAIFSLFVSIINSFVVLFTGKYWDFAYTYIVGFLRFNAKIYFFFSGLTDTYPGFDFSLPKEIQIDIPKPTNPNRFFAIPVLGGVVRIILLIPFLIYQMIVSNGSSVGVVASSFPVLFAGKYPESTYEMARDAQRIVLAASIYNTGLSDKYPSFWISMNHQTIKIILIIIGVVLMTLGNIASNFTKQDTYDNNYSQYKVNQNTY